MQIFFGFVMGGLISGLAWRAETLNTSGAIAAALVGGLIFGMGGMPWALLLLVFFVSSSLLSHAFARQKAALNEKFAKGGTRDWAQVAANGGLGAGLALASALLPGESWPWVAYAGAMAAVNADTWATELGVLNRSAPRLITTGKRAEPGTSGAISITGTAAALAGAVLVGLVAMIFADLDFFLVVLIAAVVGGLAGTLFDSLLGATVQAIYFCPKDRKETERHPLHTCGTATRRVRGLGWLTNDMVNFLCSVAGALVALGVWILLG
jgi:uncharacterized protein (TIGR00297 family)